MITKTKAAVLNTSRCTAPEVLAATGHEIIAYQIWRRLVQQVQLVLLAQHNCWVCLFLRKDSWRTPDETLASLTQTESSRWVCLFLRKDSSVNS